MTDTMRSALDIDVTFACGHQERCRFGGMAKEAVEAMIEALQRARCAECVEAAKNATG